MQLVCACDRVFACLGERFGRARPLRGGLCLRARRIDLALALVGECQGAVALVLC